MGVYQSMLYGLRAASKPTFYNIYQDVVYSCYKWQLNPCEGHG